MRGRKDLARTESAEDIGLTAKSEGEDGSLGLVELTTGAGKSSLRR